MLSLVLLGLRSLLVTASQEPDDEGVGIEDEIVEGALPFPGGKMPSADELLKMLDSMTELSDEDKASLRADLLRQAQGGGGGAGPAAYGEEASQDLVASLLGSQLFILLAMLTIISLIFVFFGYKLYKSLSERERKREEKKKNKQMKKKK